MKFIFAAYAFCIATICYSQNNRELKIGERIPDIKINKVFSSDLQLMSSYQGKKSLKEFKGKLIILDFWHTGCSSCIEAFPKMSKLQEKYKDKIQIFLVNPYESYERFMGNWSNKLKTAYNTKTNVHKYVIPSNLPVIVDAVQLGRLFPGRGGVPYHVWIDQSGVILLRGIAENTYEQKIEDVLGGKKISFVQDNFRAYDPQSKPFYSVQGLSGQKQISYSSSFGNFTENADPYGIAGNAVDSVNRCYRRTFINQSIFAFYVGAFKDRLSQDTNVLHGSRVTITSSKKNSWHNMIKSIGMTKMIK